jgi:hypothetical protein
MMPPHWLDAVIDGALLGNSPETIARSIANSDKFLAAVRKGLREANQVIPGTVGPSSAQYVRQAVCEVISSDD